MNGINKVILVATLGNDPEIRYTASDKAIANFSAATSEKWKDKQTGQQQEKTEWHRVSMFGKLAEIAGQYLKKGSKVYLEGKLSTRKWQDKDGHDRWTTEIVANSLKCSAKAQATQRNQHQLRLPKHRQPRNRLRILTTTYLFRCLL